MFTSAMGLILADNKKISLGELSGPRALSAMPFAGRYTELINSEKDIYSGCNMVNENELWTSSFRAHGLPQSIGIDLAPYAAAIFMTDIGRKAPVSEEPEQFRSAESF